jgi:hypothetical protein
MGWDPSMATTSCRICGCCIEAWIETCEECEEKETEKAETLLKEFNTFQNKFEELIGEGRDIADRLEYFRYKGTAERFRLYLLNRMEGFLNGWEMFKLDEISGALKEFIGEED